MRTVAPSVARRPTRVATPRITRWVATPGGRSPTPTATPSSTTTSVVGQGPSKGAGDGLALVGVGAGVGIRKPAALIIHHDVDSLIPTEPISGPLERFRGYL